MSRAIFKYPLVGESIQIPKDARPLAVQWQGQEPVLWAEVDPTNYKAEPRRLLRIGTGWWFNPVRVVYLGTVQEPDRPLVWHFYLEDPE